MFNNFVTFEPTIDPLTLTGKDDEPALIPYSSSHPVFNVTSFREFLDAILLNRCTELELEYAGIEVSEFRSSYYDLTDANLEDFYEDLVAGWKVSCAERHFGIIDLKNDSGDKLIGARFTSTMSFEFFPYHMEFTEPSDDSEEAITANPNGYIQVEGDAFGVEVAMREGILNVTSIVSAADEKRYIVLNDESSIAITEQNEKDLDIFIERVTTELTDDKSNFVIFFNDTALAQVVAYCVLRDNVTVLLRYIELQNAFDELQFALRYLTTAQKV